MSQRQWTAVDAYINGLLLQSDAALEAALRASAQAGLPPISVTPNQGKLLMLLARAVGARRVLEIGTLGGYSTLWLARGVSPDGQVMTLEAEPRYAEVARGNIARAGLAHVVDIRVGRAQDTLPRIEAEACGPFDLIFIDADKVSYPEYLTWSLRLSREGSLIVADNVIRDGAVIDADSADPSVRAVRRFNEMLAADPRVQATAIQTVGGKGYDGFGVALVVADAKRAMR